LAVVCQAVPYISTLSNKRMIFGENSDCVIYIYIYIPHNFVWNIYRSKKNSARYYQKYT
jgi:hypothetical protein